MEGTEPEEVRPSRWVRVLRWSAAVDSRHLMSRTERTRAAGVGALVLLVACTAAGSMAALITIVYGAVHWWTVAAALVWGAIVYAVDRAILAEPSYGDQRATEWAGDEAGETLTGRQPIAPVRRRARIGPALAYPLRVGLALVVALLVSEAVCLVLFQPEIRQVLAQESEGVYRGAVTAAVDERVRQLEKTVADNNTQIEVGNSRVAARKQALTDAQNHYYQEVDNPDRPGFGSLAATEQAKVDAAQRALDDTTTETTAADKALTGANTAIQREITDLRTPGSAGYRAIADGDVLRTAHEVAYARAGWLAQERALRTFRAAHRDDPLVQWLPWLIRALLLLIDLLPLTLKLGSPNTVHHRRVREQAALIRYADRAELALARYAQDLADEHRRNGIRLAADLAAARERHYRDARVRHLDGEDDRHQRAGKH
ncbi:DUF4407 domain-containing protein [Kitasatospora sp. NPDC049285]|uniref:DUF4407 domain-containing protein n=1 Tax=Kitasatospora sp. NPDC049285 TaxID=3157096 RepID=UPI003431933F